MWAYIIRRLLLGILTVLAITVVVFVALDAGERSYRFTLPAVAGYISQEQIAAYHSELGLDRAPYVQYFDWLFGIVTLDFGRSFFYNAEISYLLALKAPLSLQVGLMGLLIGSFVGIVGGVISALKQESIIDYVVRGVAILGISMPTFWSGMMLILIFVRAFDWMPEFGYIPLREDPLANLAQLIWPALIIGLGLIGAPVLRLMRSSLLDVMSENYIRTARGKGMSERVVLLRHAMRNALIPVLTLVSTFLPLTVTGLIVTEQMFGLPGVGQMMVDSIWQRDYTVVQAILTLSAVVAVLTNIVVDLLYVRLDPRLRYWKS